MTNQLGALFPDKRPLDPDGFYEAVEVALAGMDYCVSKMERGYFTRGGVPTFDHLHSDAYAMFLYLMSRAYREETSDIAGADKLYYLNKALHSIDVYHEVELPRVFLFRHCVGTVLGRANYGDYFTVGQNCTVGNDHGVYPTFGEGVAMYVGSTVVGEAKIGDDCHISAGTFVRGENIPSGSVAFGRSPDLAWKRATESPIEKKFRSQA